MNQQILCDAIATRQEVEISLDGLPQSFQFWPYSVWTDDRGVTFLSGYKILSMGVYPPKKVWDKIAVLKIGRVELAGGTFFVEPGFRAARKGVGNIIIASVPDDLA